MVAVAPMNLLLPAAEIRGEVKFTDCGYDTAASSVTTVGEAAADIAPCVDELVSDQVYIGTVKSYNDRRGFGFVSCSETAIEYQRDVYIAKPEALIAAAEAEGLDASVVASGATDKHPLPRLAEDDIVRFRVKASLEGFPQAVHVQKLTKMRGTVAKMPTYFLSESPSADEALGRIVTFSSQRSPCKRCPREVTFRRSACGQLLLRQGDEVAFCVPDEDGDTGAEAGASAEAACVVLAKAPHCDGSVLGCFSLQLPRPQALDGRPRQDLLLDCHAFNDKVVLAGLPSDVDKAELSRFFSKQGANQVIVVHAKGCSFASAAFPGVAEVARFVSREAHAFSDDKDTRVAYLVSRRSSGCCSIAGSKAKDVRRLPALPSPSLSPCSEVGELLVEWSPLSLAVGYIVELRPIHNAESEWFVVDPNTHQLVSRASVADINDYRLENVASSCRVVSLHQLSSYEARVTYDASCGCRAEASDPSLACVPSGTPPPMGHAPAALAYRASAAAPVPLGTLPATRTYGEVQWRCMHGECVPPTPMPELRAGDENGYAVSILWPSVPQANAYAVEFKEVGCHTTERFIRAAPPSSTGSLVELRVGGLRPAGPQRRCYSARIFSVAACGCESAPSQPGWSALMGASAFPQGGVATSSAPQCPPHYSMGPPSSSPGAPHSAQPEIYPALLSTVSTEGCRSAWAACKDAASGGEKLPVAPAELQQLAGLSLVASANPAESSLTAVGQSECLVLD